jgi:hypothetical protein
VNLARRAGVGTLLCACLGGDDRDCGNLFIMQQIAMAFIPFRNTIFLREPCRNIGSIVRYRNQTGVRHVARQVLCVYTPKPTETNHSDIES